VTDLAEIISALVLLEQQQNQPWVQRLKGAAGDAAPRLIKEMQPATPPLAYAPAQAAKVVGRSHTRIKKAIRQKELTALKDGRATLIAHAELQRWLASLPTIGRAPVQEAAHVAAIDSTPNLSIRDAPQTSRSRSGSRSRPARPLTEASRE